MIIYKYELGKLSTNCFVLVNEKTRRAVAIDIGDESEFLMQEEQRLGFTIESVLLTHGHFDHIGGVYAFYNRGVPIFIGEDEVDFISNDNLNLSNNFGGFIVPFEARGLKDGEKITLAGLEFEVIKTAGHTKGGVSYKIGDKIFCGDTLFYGSYGRVDFPTGDVIEIVKSAQKLFAYENCTLYCGHGADTTTAREKIKNPINFMSL